MSAKHLTFGAETQPELRHQSIRPRRECKIVVGFPKGHPSAFFDVISLQLRFFSTKIQRDRARWASWHFRNSKIHISVCLRVKGKALIVGEAIEVPPLKTSTALLRVGMKGGLR